MAIALTADEKNKYLRQGYASFLGAENAQYNLHQSQTRQMTKMINYMPEVDDVADVRIIRVY